MLQHDTCSKLRRSECKVFVFATLPLLFGQFWSLRDLRRGTHRISGEAGMLQLTHAEQGAGAITTVLGLQTTTSTCIAITVQPDLWTTRLDLSRG